MAELGSDTLRQMGTLVEAVLRKLIPELVPDMVRNIVREEISDVRKELTGMRADIRTIKEVQGMQNILLRTTQTDINGMKETLRDHSHELRKQGVLLEDLEHRFIAASESS